MFSITVHILNRPQVKVGVTGKLLLDLVVDVISELVQVIDIFVFDVAGVEILLVDDP